MKKLRTENEIMSFWEGSIEQPLVSISCQTYNHEEFIAEAIESFLMQKTTFPFEILINDDASTDNTQNIIKYYFNKYPNIIKPLLHKENQYKKGIKPTLTFNFPRAKGRYIAFCEGDDYWTSEYKIQTQTRVMELYSDVSISYHSATELDCKNNKKKIIGKNLKTHGYDKIENLIKYRGGYIPSQSIMLKNNTDFTALRMLINNAPIGDFYLQVYMATIGRCLYIDRPMSVYRRNTEGSWTNSQKNKTNNISYNKKMVESLSQFYFIIGNEYGKFLIDPFLYYGINYVFSESRNGQAIKSYKYFMSTLRQSKFNIRQSKVNALIILRLLKSVMKKMKRKNDII